MLVLTDWGVDGEQEARFISSSLGNAGTLFTNFGDVCICADSDGN
jgi:hypothetical protein